MALTRRRFVGLVSAGTTAGVGIGISGWRSGANLPEVEKHTLHFGSLPVGLDGISILLVSDVHAGAHMGEARMLDLVDHLRSLEPDIVLLAGDMIDGSASARDIESFVRAFSKLDPPQGVIAVPGNHDHGAGVGRISAALSEVGVPMLTGEHVVVDCGGGSPLIVLGLDDPRDRTFDPPQDQAVANVCGRAPTGGFRVLLSHRPRAFEAAARLGIPLTLAGHTHGGQIGLPWRDLTMVRLLTKYVRGHYERGRSRLVVSSGVGTGSMPFRVAVPPSVDQLTLRGPQRPDPAHYDV